MDMAMVGCLPASLHQYQTVSASFIWMQEGWPRFFYEHVYSHKAAQRKKRTAQKQQCTA